MVKLCSIGLSTSGETEVKTKHSGEAGVHMKSQVKPHVGHGWHLPSTTGLNICNTQADAE